MASFFYASFWGNPLGVVALFDCASARRAGAIGGAVAAAMRRAVAAYNPFMVGVVER
jgi:hypothetical protein